MGFQFSTLLLFNEDRNQLYTSFSEKPSPIGDVKEDFLYFPTILGLTGLCLKHRSKTTSRMKN